MTATVVFACVRNAGRSQIAAALFDALADPSKARAVSAGTRPAAEVHPEVLDTMREIGIDLASIRPRLLTPEIVRGATLIVTMGCGEECPVVPGVAREDWPLKDPAGKAPEDVRGIREEIRSRVSALLASRRWAATKKLLVDLRPSGLPDVSTTGHATPSTRTKP